MMRQPMRIALLSRWAVQTATTLVAVLLLSIVMTNAGFAQAGPDVGGAIVKSEFIYDKAPFPSCHASTIAVSKGRLVAAWFGGTDEGNKDVGIWFSRHDPSGWTEPIEVVNGIDRLATSTPTRYPCWNPVLFQVNDGPLLLFYKVGPSPSRWWGMLVHSRDGGAHWEKPTRLPKDILGPIKNKPVLLDGRRLLCGSSSEDHGWRVHLEWTETRCRTWERGDPLNDGKTIAAIQPTILVHTQSRVQILCRSKGLGKIVQAWSDDGGKTWSPMQPTSLPNPNSGIDAVTMRDGQHVLVYNHTKQGRSPLNVALSPDGNKWFAVAVLEDQPGEYSYPAVIQAPDGLVHVTYTWKRKKIRHVVLDPAKFKPRAID